MMSDTTTGADADAGGREGAPDSDGGGERRGGVERVLDALTPLTEQMENQVGFAVKYARARPSEGVRDHSTVEVRFYLPERDPEELDRARGMLQGHGFSPEKQRRGRCVFLSVPVDSAGGGRDVEREPRGSGEQSTLAGDG